MGNDADAFARSRQRTDAFRHARRPLVRLVAMLGLLLGLVVLAALAGPGFDAGSNDPVRALLAGAFLAALIGVLGLVIWCRPVAVRIGPEGVDIPLAFARSFPWTHVHRVRRCRSGSRFEGARDWLVVDPAPGTLPDYRWPTSRRLEMLARRWQTIRIPLHALDADPEAVIASVERFRPVREEDLAGA